MRKMGEGIADKTWDIPIITKDPPKEIWRMHLRTSLKVDNSLRIWHHISRTSFLPVNQISASIYQKIGHKKWINRINRYRKARKVKWGLKSDYVLTDIKYFHRSTKWNPTVAFTGTQYLSPKWKLPRQLKRSKLWDDMAMRHVTKAQMYYKRKKSIRVTQ